MKNSTSVIAALAFALAVPAFAQIRNAPPMNEQQQLERTQQELQNRENERAAATPLQFDQLDVRKAGQLTFEDAKNDPWLSRHFRLCDTDGDQRVTRAEYTACTAKPKASDADKMMDE